MAVVSVVMPAFNAERYVETAVRSVLDQTERDLEFIVVDDGSTDATRGILGRIARGDPRMKVVRQPNSGKPSIAKNRGLQFAQGELVSFLDADDLYDPERVAKCVAALRRHPEADFVFHDVDLVDEQGKHTGETYLGRVDFRDRVLASAAPLGEGVFLLDSRALFFFMCVRVSTIHTSSIMVRRDALRRQPYHFPEHRTIGEDVDLWFRLVQSGTALYVDEPLSAYRLYPNSVTKRPDRNRYDPVAVHVENYRRASDFLAPAQRRAYRRRIAADLYGLGHVQATAGPPGVAAKSFLQSWLWWPNLPATKGLCKAGFLGVGRVWTAKS